MHSFTNKTACEDWWRQSGLRKYLVEQGMVESELDSKNTFPEDTLEFSITSQLGNDGVYKIHYETKDILGDITLDTVDEVDEFIFSFKESLKIQNMFNGKRKVI